MKKTISAIFIMFSVMNAQSNVDYTTEVYPIFSSAGCLSGYCHGAGGNSGGLTMGSDAATVYSNIVDVASDCGSLDLIEPGDPSTSHLYLKCTTSWSCGGDRMPRSNQSYFTTNSGELETIRVWIEEGALEQVQQTDTTPPTLVNLTIEQDTLDLINGADTVSIIIVASDAGSGLSTCMGNLLHSNNTDMISFTGAFTAGDSLDTLAFNIIMPDSSTLGNWYISDLQLTDVDGNDTTYSTSDLASGGFDVGFVLVNSTVVSVDANPSSYPERFTLFSNYPNPFNPATTIRFVIESESILATSLLQIYDINGHLVKTLVQGEIKSGHYEIQWDASDQPSGMYFVHLTVGSRVQTQKMILLK